MPALRNSSTRPRLKAAASVLEALPEEQRNATDLQQVAQLLEAHPESGKRPAKEADRKDHAAALLTVARSHATVQAAADASRRLDEALGRYLEGM
ncbi:hypothetical protein StrepF001_42775 [Streptomyces sp. F001]|uniref:hypothetical protein n=1 Tax=Streptomyces sp. F001 TaxID=1510026 RepID=UPI00101E265D|nr:hypothetical protein [Streptomyces sp. F001]RZB13686.1 hypothetical protein StrepF001_42775 [Streptomyces sp. F001]